MTQKITFKTVDVLQGVVLEKAAVLKMPVYRVSVLLVT